MEGSGCLDSPALSCCGLACLICRSRISHALCHASVGNPRGTLWGPACHRKQNRTNGTRTNRIGRIGRPVGRIGRIGRADGSDGRADRTDRTGGRIGRAGGSDGLDGRAGRTGGRIGRENGADGRTYRTDLALKNLVKMCMGEKVKKSYKKWTLMEPKNHYNP